jgi:hypothetical protein
LAKSQKCQRERGERKTRSHIISVTGACCAGQRCALRWGDLGTRRGGDSRPRAR